MQEELCPLPFCLKAGRTIPSAQVPPTPHCPSPQPGGREHPGPRTQKVSSEAGLPKQTLLNNPCFPLIFSIYLPSHNRLPLEATPRSFVLPLSPIHCPLLMRYIEAQASLLFRVLTFFWGGCSLCVYEIDLSPVNLSSVPLICMSQSLT